MLESVSSGTGHVLTSAKPLGNGIVINAISQTKKLRKEAKLTCMRAGESSTSRWLHNSWALVTRTTRAHTVTTYNHQWLYLSLSMVRAVPTGPSVWPPLTISTIGQCSRESYSGLDQRWTGASAPAHSHRRLTQGAPRRWREVRSCVKTP